ncbi:hypothetical protein WN51_06138, partial [Melipona quadrifasciata]
QAAIRAVARVEGFARETVARLVRDGGETAAASTVSVAVDNVAGQPSGPQIIEWEETDRYSFDDSDRFEEDSLCSWSSEPESLCNNWRGWRRPTAGFGTTKKSEAVRGLGRDQFEEEEGRTFVRWFGGDSDLEWFSDLGHAIASHATRVWNCRTCALVQGDPSLMVTSDYIRYLLQVISRYIYSKKKTTGTREKDAWQQTTEIVIKKEKKKKKKKKKKKRRRGETVLTPQRKPRKRRGKKYKYRQGEKGGRVKVGGDGQKVVRTQDKESRGGFAAREHRGGWPRDSEAKGKKWGARDARNGGGKAAGRAPRTPRIEMYPCICIPIEEGPRRHGDRIDPPRPHRYVPKRFTVSEFYPRGVNASRLLLLLLPGSRQGDTVVRPKPSNLNLTQHMVLWNCRLL